MSKYLCQKCAGTEANCISLAGITKKCALCNGYAYAYYEKTWNGWEPKTISAREE